MTTVVDRHELLRQLSSLDPDVRAEVRRAMERAGLLESHTSANRARTPAPKPGLNRAGRRAQVGRKR